MKVNQLSIFLENRSGRLAEVTETLEKAGINLRALSLADTADFGILRLIVSDFEKAEALLKEKGFTVGKTEVIAVRVKDEPGALNDLLKKMDEEALNVEYMYAFFQQSTKDAIIIFRFDDINKAVKNLQGKAYTILDNKTLCEL